VLQVISSSPGDLEPVFDAMLLHPQIRGIGLRWLRDRKAAAERVRRRPNPRCSG
jgi:hypothetical protein